MSRPVPISNVRLYSQVDYHFYITPYVDRLRIMNMQRTVKRCAFYENTMSVLFYDICNLE